MTASFLDELRFRFGARLGVVLQTEATECALACLTMILGYHGSRTDLTTLRSRFPISLKGTRLNTLMQVADAMGLASRPLKLELEELGNLKLPCILHWEFKHFVVLRSVSAREIVIHDPASGRRVLALAEASKCFTGVALELWPKANFRPQRQRPAPSLRNLVGRITGLYSALAQVLSLSLALEIFTVLSPLFLQWVVDDVIVAADHDLLTTLTWGFSLLLLMQAAAGAARSWMVMYISTRLNLQGRSNVLTHMLRLRVEYFEKRHLGDLVSRFRSVDQIQNTLTGAFLEALVDGVMSVVTLIVMYVYDVILGLIATAAIALYALVRWLWYRALFEATGSQVVLSAKQETHFLESMRGIRAIKLFQRENERRSSWLSIFVDQTNASIYVQRLQIVFNLAQTVLTGAERIVIICMGARMVLAGGFSVGALMAFTQYNMQFSSRISSLIDKLFQFRLLGLYSERLADITLSEPESRGAGGGVMAPEATTVPDPTIELVDVSFRYGPDDPAVLRGVSFQVAAGESVAITGPSGCGKSTLISVIMGMRPPTSGEVRIGGTSIKSLGPDILRGMVGTVLQDDLLFTGTLADNISFFDPQADRAWIEECARLAVIHEDIVSMPMGYNSLVGDMGMILSGGQRQRVLLARAFYKRPKVLILDEATSHLDLECERLINESLKSMRLTRLVVAHRPTTIAAMQRCITLIDGRLAGDLQTTLSTTAARRSSPLER
jgi:ATP-binding cassette, subfamily B, bacterial CvaB/MchF/RaxB